MNLATAKATIEAAPNTHLGAAARWLLTQVEDIGKLDEMREQRNVYIRALDRGKEMERALRADLADAAEREAGLQRRVAELERVQGDLIAERDRLDAAVKTAQEPDPDLPRLRRLETACWEILASRAPIHAMPRRVFNRIVDHLTPHLT